MARSDRTSPVKIGDVSVFLVPMTGHSPGNCMVVIQLPDGTVIVHGGDTFYTIGQMAPGGPIRPPFFWMVQFFNLFMPVSRAIYAHEHVLRRLNVELGDKLTVFSTHDPNQYERLSGKLLD